MEYALTATENEARAGSYYDRIARLYDLTFKLNGYGRALDQYIPCLSIRARGFSTPAAERAS
jgi:hypothetical protein